MRKALIKDVRQTVGSIYSMNAPHAIGYLFNPARSGDEIANGMYCDRIDEIDHKSWEFFVAFEDICREEKTDEHIRRIVFQVKKGQIYRLIDKDGETDLEETKINLMEVST